MGKDNKNVPLYKNLYFQLLVVVVILLSGFSGYMLSTKSSVDSWNDKIYPGITVEGVDLSGTTKEEAIEIISEKYQNNIGDKKINISVGENTYTYTYSELSACYDVEKSVDEAINYGKDNGLFVKKSIIKNGINYNIDLDFMYDEEKIQNIKTEIEEAVRVVPTDAQITINYGIIQTTPDTIGYEADTENLEENLKSVLNGDLYSESNISIELKQVSADITSTDLSKIQNLLSTYTTRYTVNDRGTNVEIATSLVNGTLLMPGETFSYSEVSQRGIGQYLYANGYVNGKVEAVEAGGICQVSSTLYVAAMRANIRSVERYNHMMPVSYSPIGLDATVAWGLLDYKFTNTYDFPIYIEGKAGNGELVFNIYGDINGLNGYTYDMVSENLGTNAEGKIEAVSYLVTYQNGYEVSREYITKDTYTPYTG